MFRANATRASGARVMWNLLRGAWRYRARVLAVIGLLIVAKLAAVAVPLALKRIVDDLSRPEIVTVVPVFLLIGYALLRFSGTLFNELRNLIFSRVTQSTVADYSQNAFAHLHAPDARFHSQRQMGGLLKDIDRGTAGIAFLLGVGLFTIVPTFVEGLRLPRSERMR